MQDRKIKIINLINYMLIKFRIFMLLQPPQNNAEAKGTVASNILDEQGKENTRFLNEG